MNSRKRIVLYIIGALLTLVVLGVLILPVEVDFIRAETRYNSHLRHSIQTTTNMFFSGCQNMVRFSENGTMYILTKDGELKERTEEHIKTIATGVHAMLPTDNGVLYTMTDILYLSEYGEATIVAENVAGFSYNASDIIYSTNRGTLYAWCQSNARMLAELPDNYTEQIFANNAFIVWVGSSDILSFNQRGEAEEIPILCGSSNQYFLYNDWLVVVGTGKTGACAYNLETRELRQIDIGWYANEHDNRIAATCSENKLYLSIHSELWPKLGDEIRTATLRIDPHTWSVENVSEKFYDTLVFSDDKLYGLKSSLFIERWQFVLQDRAGQGGGFA